ncbi:MAG: MltA domain-containing protein [Methylococcales bacterium]|nr:MltA domain-containing protein [Methylococcales bacterium]
MKLSCVKLLPLILLITACSETVPIIKEKPVALSIIIDPKVIAEPPITSTRLSSLKLYPTDFQALSGWNKDNHAKAYQSFKRSCRYWNKQADHKRMKGLFDLGKLGDWKRLCKITVASGQEKKVFEHEFKPYAVNDKGTFKGLFTGYFIPQLNGSYTKTERYNIPVYRRPKSAHLRRLTRSQIYNQGLRGKGLELLWVDNLMDVFFMEVQGSGRVKMENGSLQGLSYGGSNGRSYYAIGKTLVDNDEISRKDISMQTIRAWIDQHPKEGLKLMKKNRSYVYFRLTKVKPSEGAVGAMGQPLTAQHSLAVDRKHLPLGIPIWLEAEHPLNTKKSIEHLVMAQDTGGAIKGAIRGDLYWGEGANAGKFAGAMKSSGRYYLLLPRHLSAKISLSDG